MVDYKTAKEAFVSDNEGTSVWVVSGVSLTSLTGYLLYTSLSSRWPTTRTPILDYACNVLPLIIGQSIASSHYLELNGMILVLYLLVRMGSPKPSPAATSSSTLGRSPHHTYVTVYRAQMMVMTVIAILAVDFPVFPRAFGKTETWGTSLMDIGVGSFVFAQGLAVGRSDCRNTSFSRNIGRTALKTLPIWFLGFIRLTSVKGVEYPEHVSEYGVHWNFFFTLAATSLLGTLTSKFNSECLAVIVCVAQEILLKARWQDWVVSDERVGYVGMNKEGLVSLPGYFAIFLLGRAVGNRIFSPSTNTRTKSAQSLATFAMICSATFAVLQQYGFQTSRRMANVSYVLWVVAYNTFFLLGYLLLSPNKPSIPAPPLLEALNKNGLAVFLVANVATGVVNLSMKTMYASDAVALSVLMTYTALVCTFAWLSRRRRIAL